MPIYAYRCEECGHAQDFLQKMSDPLIDTCPACGSKKFPKQLTAAGFQLKGGGWYVTDFRDNGKKDAVKSDGEGQSEGKTSDKSVDAAAASASKSDTKSDAKSESKSDSGSAASTPAAATPSTPAASSTSSTPSAKAA